ncbi:MAG TPA: L-lactate permease [Anaerolineaceae bacterium]|nr:L-lactate permease [Anaerolineaceae bacterium]
MTLNLFTWILSLLPILSVLILMLGFKWGGMRAGALSWAIAVVIAFTAYGATATMLAYAQIKAVLLALDVLTIVWGALLLLNIANEVGAIKRIGIEIPALSKDRGIQVLLVAWMLTTFLQVMGGFGVPVAIAAPILVTLGYTPLNSVVMAAIGHNWSVNFGVMAAAFNALIGVTGMPKETLASPSSILLAIPIIPGGLMIALIGGGWRGVKHLFPAVTIVGAVMAITQYLMAVNGLEMVATTGAVILGTITLLLVNRLPLYQQVSSPSPTKPEPTDPSAQSQPPDPVLKRSFLALVSPYIFVMVLGFVVVLVKPLNALLHTVRLSMFFPEIATKLGWVTPAGEGKAIYLFAHPSMLMFYSCLFAVLVYGRRGYFTRGAASRIISRTLHGAVDTSLGVIAMVSIATIMQHTGMTNILARGISESINRYIYPFFVPFIGVLGAFLTGSNNNSNVLFGVLHQEAARLMRLSAPWILAAQTTGGSIGSVMAPAKVMVGATTVGFAQKEGLILRRLIVYELVLVTLVAVITTIISAFIPSGAL